jgi:hypothetical protein
MCIIACLYVALKFTEQASAVELSLYLLARKVKIMLNET